MGGLGLMYYGQDIGKFYSNFSFAMFKTISDEKNIELSAFISYFQNPSKEET